MPIKKSKTKSKRKANSRYAVKKQKNGKVRLSKLVKSPISGKKLRAIFSDGTHTDFGASGYSDFTKHHDEARKQRYIDRHQRNENWKNMKSRGALSRYILWNKPTISASLADFRRRFG